MTLPIQIIPELLPDNLFHELGNMADELSAAYINRQIFRTDTEARVSVLNDISFPTPASKYWQAAREQVVMLEQLSILSFEYRRNEVSIRKHLKTLSTSADEFELEEAQISIDECTYKRASMTTIASDRFREIKMWSKIKHELDDNSFDTTDPNSHQLVSYTVQFALMMANVEFTKLAGDELSNLLGKFQSSIKHCYETGTIKQVMNNLPGDVINRLSLNSMVKSLENS